MPDLSVVLHGATKQATDPGTLRRALAGRSLARAYLTGGWTPAVLWAVAEHLGLSRTDVYRGARWTQQDLARVRERLGVTQKLSDQRGKVSA